MARKNNDKTLNTVVTIILLIFLMPFAGLKLLGSKSVPMQILGGLLLILGVAMWLSLAFG